MPNDQHKITCADIMPMAAYKDVRKQKRAEIIGIKKNRRMAIGPDAMLYFENFDTMWHQVHEMLHAEGGGEEQIDDELAAYNPLIPSGSNLKATFMLEFPEVDERRTALEQLAGIEDAVYAEVEGCEPVQGIADEDLERTEHGKTSAVHFMRFEFEPPMIEALRGGAALIMGCRHSAYP